MEAVKDQLKSLVSTLTAIAQEGDKRGECVVNVIQAAAFIKVAEGML